MHKNGAGEKKESAQYVKIVEWSEEDECYIGTSPGLMDGGCHGDDENAVYAELCDIVEEVIELYRADGKPLPPPTAGNAQVLTEDGYSAIWMRVTFMALARVSWWGGMFSPMATAKVLTPVALSRLAVRSAARVMSLSPMVDTRGIDEERKSRGSSHPFPQN